MTSDWCVYQSDTKETTVNGLFLTMIGCSLSTTCLVVTIIAYPGTKLHYYELGGLTKVYWFDCILGLGSYIWAQKNHNR